ncbi:glycosyltransferase [Pseudomonas sp. PDM15]|uniref:glycosyltransferase n=1 Tax=Pseudomonas sp. PDM15 TaxID=2769303 RepID=UPI001780B494|nr:glycosyltransferase [Pseudomonas sp. PDM15]MBD9426148.1 glycosyltransferase [Pseudomonas sp. PDM15]
MKFLVYSEVTAATISSNLGLPEYSYYFVLRDFLPILRELGEVIVVDDPHSEVDAYYASAQEDGEQCVFLSFSPPHKTPVGLRCPTLPVFAWEFDTVPTEHWLDEVNQDWRNVLRACGAGITHSELTVQAVKRVLGDDFPILSVPSPVWDKFSTLRDNSSHFPGNFLIRISSGIVLDTHDVALEPYMPGLDAVAKAVANARAPFKAETDSVEKAPLAESAPVESSLRITRRYLGAWYLQVLRGLLPWLPGRRRKITTVVSSATLITVELESEQESQHLEPRNQVEPYSLPKQGVKPSATEWVPAPCHFELTGVVFTTLFNPYDGRKNWVDMLTAFCAAFRENPDATLVFKLGHREYQAALNGMLMCIARLPKFECRVLLVHGYLEKAEFDNLIAASTFVVNASHGEGQCLPLMELMSCGKPAIAPRNSAMLDYIDDEVAFVVDSWLDATAWPHDPRLAYRTCRHQINWSSLVDQYQAAYRCFKDNPERYQEMSAAAVRRMRDHCSQAVAKTRLQQFLNIEDVSS